MTLLLRPLAAAAMLTLAFTACSRPSHVAVHDGRDFRLSQEMSNQPDPYTDYAASKKAAGSGIISGGSPSREQVADFTSLISSISSANMGPVTLTVNSTDGPPKTLLTCDSVLDSHGQWTPKVHNCRLVDSATLDDVLNAITEMQDSERRGYMAELQDARRRIPRQQTSK